MNICKLKDKSKGHFAKDMVCNLRIFADKASEFTYKIMEGFKI
jgi:hypothetical protein